MKTAAYAQLVNRGLATLPDSVFKRCPTLVSGGSKVTVLKPASFGSDGSPSLRILGATISCERMRERHDLDFLSSAGADGKINIVVGVPEATHANLILQRSDAVRYANIGAGSCSDGLQDFRGQKHQV